MCCIHRDLCVLQEAAILVPTRGSVLCWERLENGTPELLAAAAAEEGAAWRPSFGSSVLGW